jgi:hypothetical protein
MLEIDPSIARRLQVTVRRADAGPDEVRRAVERAVALGAAAVGVFPVFVAEAVKISAGRCVVVARVGGAGVSKPTIKAIEASSCVKDGAGEVVIEPLPAPLLAGDVEWAKRELLEVVRAVRATMRQATILVSLSSGALFAAGGEGRVESACRAVREGACDGVVDQAGDDATCRLLAVHAGRELLVRRALATRDWGEVIRVAGDARLDRVEVDADLLPVAPAARREESGCAQSS